MASIPAIYSSHKLTPWVAVEAFPMIRVVGALPVVRVAWGVPLARVVLGDSNGPGRWGGDLIRVRLPGVGSAFLAAEGASRVW